MCGARRAHTRPRQTLEKLALTIQFLLFQFRFLQNASLLDHMSSKPRNTRRRKKRDAVRQRLHDAALAGDQTAISEMITSGVSPRMTDGAGASALHLAAASGHTKVVLKLMKQPGGVEADMRDAQGRTALMFAALHNQASAMHALLRAGARIDAVESFGRTALHCCALIGELKGARMLVARGANRRALDKDGKTAADCFVEAKCGADEAPDWLKDGGPVIPDECSEGSDGNKGDESGSDNDNECDDEDGGGNKDDNGDDDQKFGQDAPTASESHVVRGASGSPTGLESRAQRWETKGTDLGAVAVAPGSVATAPAQTEQKELAEQRRGAAETAQNKTNKKATTNKKDSRGRQAGQGREQRVKPATEAVEERRTQTGKQLSTGADASTLMTPPSASNSSNTLLVGPLESTVETVARQGQEIQTLQARCAAAEERERKLQETVRRLELRMAQLERSVQP